jgi:hypothetical protein
MQLRTILVHILSAFVFCGTFYPACSVNAAYDPCYTYEASVRSAQREVQLAQSNLAKAQSDFFRAQNQVAARRGSLEAQVAQREANLNAVIASNTAWTASCVVQGFVFRFRYRSCAWVAAASINRRARAQASVNTARSNLAIYENYSAGYLQRMAARVVVAQNRANQADAQLAQAEAQYQQCIANQQ